MTDGLKRLPAIFYRTDAGNEPVREWLKGLKPEDRKVIGDDIPDLEFSWPIGLPLCRSLSGHKRLWEIRSNLTDRRIARVLFCIADGRLVLLHGFIKKARKTPEREIAVAVKRMKGRRS